MPKGEGKDMRLKIMACRQVYSGKNQRGDEYTIYEVDAANMQGQTVNQKLRSFTALPIGQEIDVTVTVFNSEQHGKSYTLHPKGRSGGGSQQQVNELREEVDELRNRVATLSSDMDALRKLIAGAPTPADVPFTHDGGAAEQLGQRFGEDAPW